MAEPNPMQAPADEKRFYRRLDPRRATLRLLVGLVIGVVGALLSNGHAWEFRLLLGWDAGAFALLSFIWFIVLTKDPHETRCRSASADPGRTATWVLVLIASSFSFFASAFVLKNLHKTQPPPEPWLLPLCLVSVIVAWSLTHTSYTLRYAHLYYRDDEEGEGGGPQAGRFRLRVLCRHGRHVPSSLRRLDFARTDPPRRARPRDALLRLYNTVVLALALNLFFGFVDPR
jgi:uncharacterized membrane protein